MIWLYLLIPVFLIGGIAIYFEKKSGMTPPTDATEKQIDKLAEMKSQQENNQNGFYQ
ncbi:MAG: hypothetical protein WAW77_08720 [Caldibacillus thermoamylovorans]|uniref:hypothetical protein n=1 Tax=Caldifermentibacillus hisashii TaxID=996558 RepID=UPI0031B7E370